MILDIQKLMENLFFSCMMQLHYQIVGISLICGTNLRKKQVFQVCISLGLLLDGKTQ